jgi:hypothetical protein
MRVHLGLSNNRSAPECPIKTMKRTSQASSSKAVKAASSEAAKVAPSKAEARAAKAVSKAVATAVVSSIRRNKAVRTRSGIEIAT